MLKKFRFVVVIGYVNGYPIKTIRYTTSKTLNGAVKKLYQEFPEILDVKKVICSRNFY